MRAHYLQHAPFEGPGIIEPWLEGNGFTISFTPFFDSAELPEIGTLDFLIIMGGPMSVNDEGRFPWLRSEKRFIRLAIERDIVTHCSDELVPARYVQSAEQILTVAPATYQAVNALMADVLSFLSHSTRG